MRVTAVIVNTYFLKEHAQSLMKRLGITYLYAAAHPVADYWKFWGCSIPEDTYIPDYIRVYTTNPIDSIDKELTSEEAIRIQNFLIGN